MASLRASLAAALVALALVTAACGTGEVAEMPAADPAPQRGGTLRIALADEVGTIDPLFASTRAERLVARQIYEPLVAMQSGPFQGTRRLRGIARSLEPRRGATLWIAHLRAGVSFSDGTRLDADAVKANAARWIAAGAVPGLGFVDSPRPGLVRFFAERPLPDLERTLARAELGLVAPAAIAAAGEGAVHRPRSGAGPFELRERDGGDVLLARNSTWWGTPLGLGPGVDQVELLVAEDAPQRAEQLEAGEIQVADELRASVADAIGADPLLVTLAGRSAILGVACSVRGLDTAAADQPLADVWLTDLG